MTRSTLKKLLLAGVGIAGVGALLFVKVYLPKISFDSVHPVVADLSETVLGVGTVEAKEVSILSPKTTAKLASLFADQGDRVPKGKILAVLEPSDLAASREDARAAVTKNRLQKEAQTALLEDLEAKNTLTQTTLSRYAHLVKDGFVTQAELDTAQAAGRGAKAQLESAKTQILAADADIRRSEAQLKVIDAKIDDLVLRSPADTLVLSRDAEVGSTVTAGTSVFRLANPALVWVSVSIDERQSGALAVGQQARIWLRSRPDTVYAGTIRRIGAQSDRVTEEKTVDVAFAAIPSSFTIGEQAEVVVTTASHPHTLTIPQAAVVMQGGKKGVWVNGDGNAHFKEVKTTGISREGLVGVTGVSADEKVIIPAGRTVSEGMRVRP